MIPFVAPEHREIKEKIDEILRERGIEEEIVHTAKESGLEEDAYSTITVYEENGLRLIKNVIRYQDEVNKPSFMVYDAGTGFFKRFLNEIGLYEGNKVFEFVCGEVHEFKEGDWQKRLESIVA